MQPGESGDLAHRAAEVFAGGVSSDARRAGRPTCFVRGEGAHVWDERGRRYVDFTLGQGPLILGHTPEVVRRAVAEQLERGWVFAAEHPLSVRAAEMVRDLVPCAELVRFNSTGSEAVHAALRLARACTGRPLVVKFDGHYHGWYDGVLWAPADGGGGGKRAAAGVGEEGGGDGGAPARLLPGSEGIAPEAGASLRVLPWNDLAAVEALFAREGGRVAAVVCEPVMCNQGCIEPEEGFLAALRAVCDRYGAVLVFDEVITGFRLSPGGAQGYYGVAPDLAVLGKALGAGFPVSALVGRRRFMQWIADGRVAHAGTFNTHAVCMAAVVAGLGALSADAGAVCRRLGSLGVRMRDGINRAARARGAALTAYGPGPMFQLRFGGPERIRNLADHRRCDAAALAALVEALAERGVRVLGRGLVYLSAAHTEEHVDAAVAAVGEVLALGR